MTKFLDFDAIKQSASIEQVMELTGLPFKKDGDGFRCECPVHKGGKRSLAVTPSEKDEKGDPGVFYCFGEKVGGDRVGLLAHVNGTKQYAAFLAIAKAYAPQLLGDAPKEATAPPTVPEEKEETSKGGRGFQPLPYLVADHRAVTALGIPPEIARASGIGYAPRGHHREGVAVPVRTENGLLLGYISLSESGVKLPPKWSL